MVKSNEIKNLDSDYLLKHNIAIINLGMSRIKYILNL
jgi:hypothetical protein